MGHRGGRVHKADKAPKGAYSLAGKTSDKSCEENKTGLDGGWLAEEGREAFQRTMS